MGTGIDLFLDRETGIWVAGTGIWPLGMGNEVLKNGNGIEVMRVDSQIFHVLSILKYNFDPFLVSLVLIFIVNYTIHSTTCEQAYSGTQNSGFSDYPEFWIFCVVPKSDEQRNICLVSGIYFI
jgi:hypothetical protein